MIDKNKMDLIRWCFVLAYPKTGSTSMSGYLHDIGLNLPKDTKETYHFCQNNNKSYMRHYKINDSSYYGEVTTTVIYNDDCLKKMHKEFPDAKIIVLLRDPIKRAISKYNHMVRRYGTKESFSQIIRNEDKLFSNYSHHSSVDDYIVKTGGEYLENCLQVLNYFPKKNVLFLLTEELSKEPELALSLVKNHLGLSGDVNFNLNHRKNQSRTPYSKHLTFFVVKFQQAIHITIIKIRKLLPASKLDGLLFRPIVKFLSSLLNYFEELTYSSRKQTDSTDMEDIQYLEKYFNTKLSSLDEVIGKNLSLYWGWYKKV